MARERQVTRTITATVVKYMAVELDKGEVCYVDHTFAGELTSPEKALAVGKRMYDSDRLVLAKVVDMNAFTNLYAMSEEEFMSRATIVPNKGKYGERIEIEIDTQ